MKKVTGVGIEIKKSINVLRMLRLASTCAGGAANVLHSIAKIMVSVSAPFPRSPPITSLFLGPAAESAGGDKLFHKKRHQWPSRNLMLKAYLQVVVLHGAVGLDYDEFVV